MPSSADRLLSKLAKPLDVARGALLSLSVPSSPWQGLLCSSLQRGVLGLHLQRPQGREEVLCSSMHVTTSRFLSPCLAFLLGGRSEVLWINPRAHCSPLSVLQGPETAFCSLEGQL